MTHAWNDPSQLRSLSNILQWAAIALVFLGGILQLAKFTVDRREKALSSNIQSEHETELQQQIAGLQNHLSERQKEIAGLKSETSDLRSEAAQLRARSERLDPLQQTIKSATATTEVTIVSSEQLNSHYMDSGGYLAFGKGQDALMVVNSIDCFAVQQGGDRVLYRGTFSLDATSAIVGKPISTLKEAEYLQIGFQPMKPKQQVIGGRVVVTVNSAVRLEFEVPAQQMPDNFIIVPHLTSVLAQLK